MSAELASEAAEWAHAGDSPQRLWTLIQLELGLRIYVDAPGSEPLTLTTG